MDSPGPRRRGEGSFLMFSTAGEEKVLEVKRLDNFKKVFNVWVSDVW